MPLITLEQLIHVWGYIYIYIFPISSHNEGNLTQGNIIPYKRVEDLIK